MIARKVFAAILISCSTLLTFGCGADENGSAQVVSVSAGQRANDLNAKAEQTVSWLEKMPAPDRQASLDRTPQIKSALRDASDPAIKSRIAALGVQL